MDNPGPVMFTGTHGLAMFMDTHGLITDISFKSLDEKIPEPFQKVYFCYHIFDQ